MKKLGMKPLWLVMCGLSLGALCSSAWADDCDIYLALQGPAGGGSIETGPWSTTTWDADNNGVLQEVANPSNGPSIYYSPDPVYVGTLQDGNNEIFVLFPPGSDPSSIFLGDVACNPKTRLAYIGTLTGCSVNNPGTNNPTWTGGSNCTASIQSAGSAQPSYSQNGVIFNFRDRSAHTMLVYAPQSSADFAMSPDSGSTTNDADKLELKFPIDILQSSTNTNAVEVAEVNGARFYISNTADQGTFDTDIGLTLPSSASTAGSGSSYNMGNAMGLVQIEGGSFQSVASGTSVCDFDHGDAIYSDLQGCFNPPLDYVWEVAPANVVGSCPTAGYGGYTGAFCWFNDGGGSAGFQLDIQDPPGRIVGS